MIKMLEFDIEGLPLLIEHDSKNVYLCAPNKQEIQRIIVPIETPGPYDTSTPTSTYDQRGEITINLSLVERKPKAALINMEMHRTCEYWYMGSIDDDWKRAGDTDKKSELVVKLEGTELSCGLKDIN